MKRFGQVKSSKPPKAYRPPRNDDELDSALDTVSSSRRTTRFPRQDSRSLTTSGDLTEEVAKQEPVPTVIVKKVTPEDEDATPYEHSHGAVVFVTQNSLESSAKSCDLLEILPSPDVSRIPMPPPVFICSYFASLPPLPPSRTPLC